MLQTQGTVGRFVIYVTNTRYSGEICYVTNTRYNGKICYISYKHKVQWEDLLCKLQTQGTVGRFVV